MAEKPNDPNEIGALWIKTGARGDYMTGTINGQPVVLFKNDRKLAGSNQLEWDARRRRLRSEERGQAWSYRTSKR